MSHISSTVIRQASQAGPCILRYEKRYLQKNGRMVWGGISSTRSFDADGNFDSFVAQVLDINERKRAEEALKKVHDELEEKVRGRTAELSKANEQLRRGSPGTPIGGSGPATKRRPLP